MRAPVSAIDLEPVAAATIGPPLTVEALLELRRPTEAVVSADGTKVAFSVLEPVPADSGDGVHGGIWVAEGGEAAVRVTSTGGVDTQPRWSPDGRELAFVSDAGHPGRMSVYVLAEGQTRPVSLGSVAGSVEQIAWSRDGRSLLLLAADPGLDTASSQLATTIRGDRGDGDPLVIRPTSAWRRLYLIDRDSGEASAVLFDRLTVWEFDWDGERRLAAVVSPDPSESGWYTAHLELVELGADVRRLARIDSEWQIALPRLSPDGTGVAYLEGVCSDRGILAGVPMWAAVGESPSPIVAGMDVDCTWIQWQDGATLWCAGWRGLGSVCGTLEPGGGFTEVWSGATTLGSRLQARISVDRWGGRVVAVCESANVPPEVVELDPGAPSPRWNPLTQLNRELAAHALPAWSRARWVSTGGREIEGLVALPADSEPRPLPLVVLIHGGPSSSWTAQWTNFGMPTMWTSAGYAVLMPNPRGSVGYGQEFARSTIGDMGGGELQDVLFGIDALVAGGIADDGRVGILGSSHGGYLTAWAVTQTPRFAAALAMAAPSDRLSKHNGGNIGYLEQLFWDPDPYDPGGAVIGRSPIMHVRNVQTPTLIVHGEIDQCVPIGQAFEFYRGIARENRAEVELVIYPREGHSLRERAHLIDFWGRARRWFDDRL
jgi:dipeptidyl aminopeptidase/acylaminoacyl peptidase